MTHELASSGVPGLDHLLAGGFPSRRMYLLHGPSGSGKTTLAMQFAMQGVKAGETTLFVALAETHEELLQIAESHGWDIGGVSIFSPSSVADDGSAADQYTLFHPGEVELSGLVSQITERIKKDKPARVVIDSMAEIRLLARDPLILIRQLRIMRMALTGTNCTVLLLENPSGGENASSSLQTFAHGIIELDRDTSEYGTVRRGVTVLKLRGANIVSGRHDMKLATGGITVYPRLAPDPEPAQTFQTLRSGSVELDRLCGGGLETGSSAAIIGPAGTGKSTVAAQYALTAAEQGVRSVFFLFDETEHACRKRWAGLNIPLAKHVDNGTIDVHTIDPTTLSPGEFCHRVRRHVEKEGARLVVIDSLSGYMQVRSDKGFMQVHLYELLQFLNARDVLSLLVVTQHGVLGTALESPIDVSYLIDTILLLRFFEAQGEVRKAVSLVKKRLGAHERTIRECRLGPRGVQVGEPLKQFQGVLTGNPTFRGPEGQLIQS